MLKRWSSKFGRDRKNENGVTNGTTNGTTNGINGHNETSNGTASTHGNMTNGNSPAVRRSSTFGFHKHEKKDVERKDIDGMFQEFAQLIHASKRPIPNQNGDGTYNGN
jgi:linoleate 10R-lipoxygenase